MVAMNTILFGSAEISAIVMEALAQTPNVNLLAAVTQPDRPAGRKRLLTPCPCKAKALELAVPVFSPERINGADAMDYLRKLAPELIVVVAYGQFLGRSLLHLPKFGCVNLHVSLLPRYRGAAPIQAAILNGDQETGVTLMQMDEGMDTGPILATIREPILPTDTTGELTHRLSHVAAKLLVDSLPSLSAGNLPPQSQDDTLATYAPKIKKEEGVLDWIQPADALRCRIHAFNPWPGTTANYDCSKGLSTIKIHRVEVRSIAHQATPGTLLAVDQNGPIIACGIGALCLKEVQPLGKRSMSGLDFLRGTHLPIGTLFH